MQGNVRVRAIRKGNASGPMLRGLREGMGMSLKDAAARIGCDPSTLRRWEREGLTGRVRAGRVFSVCTVYHVSVDSLFAAAQQSTELGV